MASNNKASTLFRQQQMKTSDGCVETTSFVGMNKENVYRKKQVNASVVLDVREVRQEHG